MTTKRTTALLLALFLLAGCAADRVFYYPNRKLYADPHAAGLEYEIVRYPSLNGKMLTGLYFEAPGTPKGVVVHCHGNFGNVSIHYGLVTFLAARGYDLLVFDYQGFGASEGRPSPKRTVEDAVASVRYAGARGRGAGVALFGQSVGAAVAAVAAVEAPEVKGVLLEAGFSRYRAIAREVLRRRVLTWPLAHVFPPLFVRKRYDPVDFVGRIAPRPLLIVHGTADGTVPARMSKELYERAGEPKRLWLLPGGGHLRYGAALRAEYERQVADFFDGVFASTSTAPR